MNWHFYFCDITNFSYLNSKNIFYLIFLCKKKRKKLWYNCTCNFNQVYHPHIIMETHAEWAYLVATCMPTYVAIRWRLTIAFYIFKSCSCYVTQYAAGYTSNLACNYVDYIFSNLLQIFRENLYIQYIFLSFLFRQHNSLS